MTATLRAAGPVRAGDPVTFALSIANHSTAAVQGAQLAAGVRGRDAFIFPGGRRTLELNGLHLAPGGAAAIGFTADAGCGSGPYRWSLQVGGAAVSLPTIPVDGECQLSFVTQPADAEAGAGITSEALDPQGTPIQVQVESDSGRPVGGSDQTVTLSIDTVPPGGTSQLDGTTTVQAVDGIATFCDPNQTPGCELPSIGEPGQGYTLKATAGGDDGEQSAISEPFDVVGDGVVCPGGQCSVQTREDETQGAVIVPSAPGDTLQVSLGVDELACAGYASSSEVMTFESTSAYQMKVRLKFEAPVGPTYQACFSSTQSFVDRDGNVVPPGGSGLLPDCGEGVVAPCLVSRSQNVHTGYVTLKLLAPAGDPKVVG